MAKQRKVAAKPPNKSGPINLAAIDDMLDGIEAEIPAYQMGDKVEFVHAGGKFKGSVIKVLEAGKLHVADAGATVFKITTDDICKNGETASQLLARKNGKRPVYVSHTPGLSDDDDLMSGIELPKKKPVRQAVDISTTNKSVPNL